MKQQTTTGFGLSDTTGLVKAAIVAAIYVVLTLMVAPLSFGVIQFRVSEILNFLGLYNPRYIVAITLGVVIANMFNPASYGVADMLIGSLSTFVFLWLGRIVGERLVALLAKTGKHQVQPMIIKYLALIVVFSLSMITIAFMICHFENIWPLFWPTYWSLVASEAGVLSLGALVMYPLATRIDFHS
ncbi:QueT transporter family protein [Aerococcaceae bacterium NML191292]|nr:QueT transporter family protein [Aerococcaceae bacterium NML191292]